MAKNAVLQFFQHISPPIQITKIKLGMHIHTDTLPIHIYFQDPTSFTFGAIVKKFILASLELKENRKCYGLYFSIRPT